VQDRNIEALSLDELEMEAILFMDDAQERNEIDIILVCRNYAVIYDDDDL